MLEKLQQFAKDAHQPAVPGTFSDRTLHQRDRQAKKDFAAEKKGTCTTRQVPLWLTFNWRQRSEKEIGGGTS